MNPTATIITPRHTMPKVRNAANVEGRASMERTCTATTRGIRIPCSPKQNINTGFRPILSSVGPARRMVVMTYTAARGPPTAARHAETSEMPLRTERPVHCATTAPSPHGISKTTNSTTMPTMYPDFRPAAGFPVSITSPGTQATHRPPAVYRMCPGQPDKL